MSETDSFIAEVTEEVRRDRLFLLFRRYGWIAVLAVVLLVGSAAYREYRKVQDQTAAEVVGDAVLAAVGENDLAVRSSDLAAIAAESDGGAIVTMLSASTDLDRDERAQAAVTLEALANDATLAPRYHDLAALKRLMILAPQMEPQARIDALTPLATPGAPYRLLAEEQIALAELALDKTDDAIARFNQIAQDQAATPAIRERATDMVVALGGTPPEAN